jgi:hypothetical protein
MARAYYTLLFVIIDYLVIRFSVLLELGNNLTFYIITKLTGLDMTIG